MFLSSSVLAVMLAQAAVIAQQEAIVPPPATKADDRAVTGRGLDPIPTNEELRKRGIAPETQRLIDDLGASDYAKRRAASTALLGETVPVDDLVAALANDALSPEQRHRLVAIATDRILTQPFGAIGVNMDVAMRGGLGVRITGCVAGMPAEKHLQVDDVIVAIAGRAVREHADLSNIVQSLAPGTEVRVEALRTERDAKGKQKLDGEGRPITKRIEVKFALGSSRQLEEAASGSGARLPVSVERQELARSVIRRFAPQPVLVSMPEDREAARRFATHDPDTHPDIQALKRLREMFEAERRSWDANTLNALHATLAGLRRQSQDPSYPPVQREWFGRVAQRYEELIPPGE